MKIWSSFLIIICLMLTSSMYAQQKDISKPDSTKKIQVAEVSCGQCKFGLKGKSCDLAVRIQGKAYFVDGAHIDSFGDAHASTGFCQAVRKAELQGEVVDGRFVVSYLKLLPVTK